MADAGLSPPEFISPSTVRERLVAEEALLLVCAYDSPQACRKYRIEDALSLTDLVRRREEISPDQEIVFYCACEGDKTAIHHARDWKERGFLKSRVMEGGLSAWLTAGYPPGPRT